MSTSPFRRVAPIVGAPAVHQWRCVVSFSCSCGTGRPMLITAADQAEVCDGCGDTYRLMQLHYDGRKSLSAGVEIARIPRAAAQPSMPLPELVRES